MAPSAAMFVVVYDPPAADDLARFLSDHGCRAWKRTPFVVEIEGSANEGNVERLFSEWREVRHNVAAELITRSRLENLTRA